MALFVLSTAVALGIRRGLTFSLAVIAALILYLVLAPRFPNPFLPVLAGGLGFGLTTAVHYIPLPRLAPAVESVIGGIGGLVWGIFLALSIWVSFPSEFVVSSDTYRYPSSQLPIRVQDGISSSPFARLLFDWASSNPVLKVVLLPQQK